VAECTGFENRRGFTSSGGSNPSPTAIFPAARKQRLNRNWMQAFDDAVHTAIPVWLSVLLAASCDGPAQPADDPTDSPPTGSSVIGPSVIGLGASTPSPEVAEALAVWKHGATAIAIPLPEPSTHESEPPSEEIEWTTYGEPPSEPFQQFDEDVRDFLKSPSVHDAVPFGCARCVLPIEEWVTAALGHEEAIVRLRALVVLMHVRAPESIIKQWQVLQELQDTAHGGKFTAVTSRLEKAFAAESLSPLINSFIPSGRFTSAPAKLQWALRAAGVAQHAQFLPRLVKWARSNEFNSSRAAEARSQGTAGARQFRARRSPPAFAE
jgi:hypothetical protein